MKVHRKTLGHWLLQIMTTIFLSLGTILIANVAILILLNINIFGHIHVGIEYNLTYILFTMK
jgi:hypothetical protein